MKRALLILLIFIPLCSFSQKSNSGTEFWMAFMKNYDSSYSGKRDSLRLYISATARANVTISIPLKNYSSTIVVPKDSVTVFLVPLHLGFIVDYEQIQGKAIHITSDFPVSISAMNLLYATTDASIVLPYTNIPNGTTYISGNPSGAVTSQIMLVAGQDSTKVEITPTGVTKTGFPKNVPFYITLNRGQIYQIGSSADLSGSIIKVLSANKLVAFSGDRCSNWPCGACDHQFEQILPNDVLDTAYCIPSHFGHTKGYYIKMIPLDSSTDITVNGFTYRNISRLKPLVINVKGDSGYYASSNKLFHCHQFLKGAGGCNGYINSNYGDPAQLEMVSTKHFGEASLFSTVNSFNLKDHFVNIVINTSAKNNVYLNKTKIDSSEFIEFQYAKRYSFAKIKINLGQHLVECSNGLLAYCYGVGYYESYLYLAGFSLPRFDLDFKDSVITYDCKNKKILMQFNSTTAKKLKKYTWYFGDNTTALGNPIQHLYTPGIYSIKLVGEDFSGKKDSITRKLNINWPDFDPVRDKIICGNDTVTYQENNPFFANFKWQDNSTKNYFKAWSNKNIYVVATDSSGYCKFADSGTVSKIDIFSSIVVDSIEKCWKYNKFIFKDSTKIFADDILHKAWVFPWKTLWDTSKIEVRFPMPGKYRVYFDVYTTNVNCKARYPIDLVVNPMPKVIPKIKGELFCSDNPILFYDSSQIVTGYIKKVKWLFDDATSPESDSLKIFKNLPYNPGAADVVRFYKHIAISDRNCSDTALNAALVWPKPKADFTMISPDTIQCLPNARWTFNSTSTVAADTMKLYWDAGNGKSSTNYFMKNIRYFTPGKYKVKLKAVSTFGCMDSITKIVEAIAVPKAEFLINDSAQCYKGHSFNFRDTSIGQYLTYLWTLGNGYTSTKSKVDSVKYNGTGSQTIKLKINSPYAGCEDSVSHNIHIFEEPIAKIKVNKDTQCLSANLYKVQNNSTFYRNYRSSEWVTKNFADTNFNPPGFSYKDTGNFILSLVVKDIEGCSDTVFKKLRISAQPFLKLTINDSIQCFKNNRFVFRTTNLNNETNDWKINNKIVYSGQKDSLQYIEINTGTNTVSLIRQTMAGCRDSISKNYRLLEAIKPAYFVNKDSQCFNGHSFDFTDISSAKNDIINSWKYIIDNTQSYTGQAHISNINFLNEGIKTVKLIVRTKEGCVDSTNGNITIFADPIALITGDSICLHNEANIKALQTSGQTITNWDWLLGDGNIANSQSFQHTYANPGNYTLTLTVKDIVGCTNTLTQPNGTVVYALPDATFSFSKTDYGVNQCMVHLKPVLYNSNKYLWKLPDGRVNTKDTTSMLVTDLLKGEIMLRVTDQYGCTDSTVQSIYVFPNNFNVYLPGAITTNGDDLNDVFKLEGLTNAQNFKFKVYSRWGEELFFTTDATTGWDGTYQGKPVPDGIYMYYISFSYYDGKSYEYRGSVTVLK